MQYTRMSVVSASVRLYNRKKEDKFFIFQNSQLNSCFLQQQKRSIIHLPIIGILGPKVIAALALKKAVVVAFLRKYGVKGTFEILRRSNDELGKQLGTSYPPSAQMAVRTTLDALEVTVSKLEPTEQIEVLWNWLKSIDPKYLTAFLNHYVTFVNPVELKPSDDTQAKETKEMENLLKLIAERVPELKDKYNVILIEKINNVDSKTRED